MPFIFVVVFIDVLGIGIALPVLPMLVGEFTLSRELQSYWYGALVVVYGVMQFFCAPLLGALSDRFGRRPVLLWSLLGLGAHFLLLALSSSLLLMLLARIVGGMAGASFPVANAYASDVTPPERRAASFGLVGAAFGLGFIFGPMIGGLLGGVDLRLPFFAAAGLSLLNAAYGYLVVPESLPRERRTAFSLVRANPFTALVALARHREIGNLVVVFALVVLAQLMLQTTWVLYTHFRFDWGPRENGFALFCVGLVATVVRAFCSAGCCDASAKCGSR
jgi:DHA1 family tetracycline resistance protein-like MFS transporter